jgi:hypothetical protein
MLQGMMALQPAYRQSKGQTEVLIDFFGAAWDAQQPIVAVIFGDNLDAATCAIKQQEFIVFHGQSIPRQTIRD